MKKAVQQLDSIIYNVIHQNRLDGNKNDLLTMLLEARDGDSSSDQRLAGMSDKQLRDEAMTLFLAGHETTAIALSWTWYLLSQHPEVEAKLLTELNSVLGGRSPKVADLTQLKYTRWVINESLRLYPPAWTIGRQSLNECEIGGYQIPVGSIILMSQWVMHHDPLLQGTGLFQSRPLDQWFYKKYTQVCIFSIRWWTTPVYREFLCSHGSDSGVSDDRATI